MGRLYNNIISYANSKFEIDADSRTLAYWRSIQYLRKIQKLSRPLHERGNLNAANRGGRSIEVTSALTDQERIELGRARARGMEHRVMRRILRDRRWRKALYFKGVVVAHMLDLMMLDDAEKLADELTGNALRHLQHKIVVALGMNDMGFRVGSVTVWRDNENQRFDRSSRQSLILWVSDTMLRLTRNDREDLCLRVDPVLTDHRKAILLHVEPVRDGFSFARWVCRPGRRQPITMLSGAMCGDELVPGYNSVEDIVTNEKAIREQAHVMRTFRILRGEHAIVL